MKQQKELRYIYKIHSSVLKRSKWKLNLTIEKAQKNGQLISLANSQLIDFIDEIQQNEINKERLIQIKKRINKLQHMRVSLENRNEIKNLYIKKNSILFINGYVEIVMDTKKDFDKCCKGFIINNKKYKRLLGTTGGIKKSTIIFVSEDLYNLLDEKINNGRNRKIKLVPAKLEAYKALTCSASIKVTQPKGVLVVKDLETTFKEDFITIKDSETDRPILKPEKDLETTISPCDGCGIILPSLSRIWTKEVLGKDIDEPLSGFCIRNGWCKGMLFTFDFLAFSKKIAKKKIVKDIWGNDIDINTVQIIITDNMLKLWNCYDNIDNYLYQCEIHGYSFRVSKYCEPKLENERNLNYQFIQSYDLNDNELNELIKPTVNEIKDVLGGDYRKSLLFLKGIHMTDENAFIRNKNTDIVNSLMIEPSMIKDSFIRDKIHNAIKKRIRKAKIGVLKMKGCYSIISGDVYALCQHIFGLKVTGLLNSGEYYSRYWLDKGNKQIVAFRAPMTSANNIRKFNLVENEEINYWFKYMKTCIIFNAFDSACIALNGCDFDSDALISTNNSILLQNTRDLSAILCVQKTAHKKIVNESDLIKSNKTGFGDGVGIDTNRITTMIEVLARFLKNSKEYNELSYRIMCGQHFQQCSIDKAKGIISKPMPKEWYSYRANEVLDTDTEEIKKEKEFNISILAEKKPYFFIYNYPKLMNEYKRYINNSNEKAMILYGKSIDELIKIDKKTDEIELFLKYYKKNMPVGNSSCIMNRICHKIEDIFDNKATIYEVEGKFDYKILRNNSKYTKKEYALIEKLYKEYSLTVQQYSQTVKSNKVDRTEEKVQRILFKETFKQKALELCNNKYKLSNIILDLCYKKNSTKQFAWDICGDAILETLLEKNNYKITYPVKDDNGNFNFGGYKFSMKEQIINKGDFI